MTVADLKKLSLGFVIDFCVVKTQMKNDKYKSNEEKYNQLKDVLPFVQEDYENGKIDDIKYNDFDLMCVVFLCVSFKVNIAPSFIPFKFRLLCIIEYI